MTEPVEASLEITDPAGRIVRQRLAGARMVIGRSPDVEITLADPSVSRQHAEVFTDPFGRWWIRDLGSRNGTRINGQKVDEHLLRADDRIEIEAFKLLYQAIGPEPQRPRSASSSGLTITDSPGDDISRLTDLGSPKIDATHLSQLTQLSSQLLATEPDAERLALLCRMMIDRSFHGNTAVAFRISKGDEEREPQMLCEPMSSRNWRGEEQPYISRTLLRGVVRNEAPVVASNVASGGNVMALSLAGNVQKLAAIACPIHKTAEYLDVVYVTFPGEYGTPEWLALAALAAEQFQQAHEAWIARRKAQDQAIIERELEHAARIQNRLIPRHVNVPGIEVAIGFEPCKWVGGDYVDVLEADDGKVYITICDVCGKGIQAALVTASLHTLFHTTVQARLSLADAMERLNTYLESTLPDESFVTAICLILNTNTGAIELSNAGHPPAMIVGVEGKARELASGENPPLGYIPIPFECGELTLENGEMLALFTDGLTEAANEQNVMLGIPGVASTLEKLVADHPGADLKVLAARLIEVLDAHEGAGGRGDDRTFMLIRRR